MKAKAKVKIEDVFTITGRGNVLTGFIIDGEISLGDSILLGEKLRKIKGIERVRTMVPNSNCGLLIGSEDSKEELLKYKGMELIIYNETTKE